MRSWDVVSTVTRRVRADDIDEARNLAEDAGEVIDSEIVDAFETDFGDMPDPDYCGRCGYSDACPSCVGV